jgi:hypothetical protein
MPVTESVLKPVLSHSSSTGESSSLQRNLLAINFSGRIEENTSH